ncbi:MAG: aldo/keto reductase, partial [Armatimonadota bacterium]
DEMGVTAAQLAIGWCLRHEAVTSVIIGATRVEQMEETIAAADVEVPDDVYQRLNDLFRLPRVQAP